MYWVATSQAQWHPRVKLFQHPSAGKSVRLGPGLGSWLSHCFESRLKSCTRWSPYWVTFKFDTSPLAIWDIVGLTWGPCSSRIFGSLGNVWMFVVNAFSSGWLEICFVAWPGRSSMVLVGGMAPMKKAISRRDITKGPNTTTS